MTPTQTKLLEDLRSGAVRLVPGEATPEMIGAFWRQKNTGTQELGSWGDATSDYDAYRAMLSASPDLTPALVEMIEGLVRERDEAWADWSALPKDLYVTEVRTGDGIVFDVALCSVPMAIGPEVRYSRAETPRCEHCDGTGDAHSIDGEWRGYCACPAGVALTAEAERDALREALAWLGEKKSRSLSFDGRTFCEDDNSDLWTVTEERGSRNDREWVVLGSGNTPTEALLNASTAARAPRRPAND